MHICVIRFSFGIFHQALAINPDQVEMSVKEVIWITFTWWVSHKRHSQSFTSLQVTDFSYSWKPSLKLWVVRIASVAKTKFRMEVK